MTNYDKIKNMSIDEMNKELTDKITLEVERITNHFVPGIEARIKNWLQQEVKPTLSESERVILENIDKDYKWICRDADKRLFVFKDKPETNGLKWWHSTYKDLRIFNHLFQFITWEDSEPYNIEELLEN